MDNIKTGAVDKALKKLVGDDLVAIIDGEEKNENFYLSTRNLQKVLYLPQLVSYYYCSVISDK